MLEKNVRYYAKWHLVLNTIRFIYRNMKRLALVYD